MQRDLVVRAQSGDLDAFSALTAGATNRLFGAARLILRDDEHAADAVQDALLQAWLDLRGLRDPDRFDAWLHRLLVRACYRAAKRGRQRAVVELALDSRQEPTTPDAQRAVAVRDQLDRGFRRLSPEQRVGQRGPDRHPRQDHDHSGGQWGLVEPVAAKHRTGRLIGRLRTDLDHA